MSKDYKLQKQRFFFDTEFVDGEPAFSIGFISIGIAPLHGKKSYYGVSSEFNDAAAGDRVPWLRDNVLDKLPNPSERLPLKTIAEEVLAYFEPAREIELWAKNGSYDNFALCQLFGGMGKMHEAFKAKGVDRVTFRDINELVRAAGLVKLAHPKSGHAHHALKDAYWDRRIFKKLREIVRENKPGAFDALKL